MTKDEAARYARLRELFLGARELEEHAREAYVRAAAGKDAELASDVLRLLASDGAAGEFLERPALEGGVPGTAASLTREPGEPAGRDPSTRRGGTRKDEEYPPGRVLVGRYRVVTRIGEGGMGEVYLADDLTLEEPVAIKFLPRFSGSLTRLRHEVRLARSVSHPNVARVHDIGEVDGRHFLTMEYVDGEDLGSLLRQIGRLPREKALDISRQICEGLSAAHEHGILHRDLKPSNVMLDLDGRVRLMDFGVATFAERESGHEVAGTPAYMAPEQVSGREVSIRTEVFSLGLVLFELFTGRRAIRGKTLLDVLQEHRRGWAPPADALAGLEPEVARAIERCLAPDPAARPTSARLVARMLPGGDPLEAAIAAGETPSPRLIAGASAGGVLEPRRAWGLAGLTLAGTALSFLLWTRTQPVAIAPLVKRPEVLADRAREFLAQTLRRPSPEGLHELYGFTFDEEAVRARLEAEPGRNPRDDWDHLFPSPVLFWFRSSPNPLVPVGLGNFEVRPDNPPNDGAGMARVTFDPRGLLVSFELRPLASDVRGDDEVEWGRMFELAGLEPSDFEAAEPATLPRGPADRRHAWSGPGAPAGRPVRVEAASFRGVPVAFEVAGPAPAPRAGGQGSWIEALVKAGLILGGLAAALRNLRSGRGDRQGASRLALFVLCCSFLSWALRVNLFLGRAGLEALLDGVANALLRAGLVWVFYVAAEAYVRRLWPRILTTWMRVLAGSFRDRLVARDVLVGAAFGTLLAVVFLGYEAAPVALIGRSPLPDELVSFIQVASLSGPRAMLGHMAYAVEHVLVSCLMAVVLLMLVRLVVRHQVLSIAVLWALLTFAFNFHSGGAHVLVDAFGSGLVVLVLIRFGLVALTSALCIQFLLVAFPHPLGGWQAEGTPIVLGAVAGITLCGVLGATRGKLSFQDAPLS